jgi:hypothetical protein
MGAPTKFLFISKEPYWLAHQQIFETLGTSLDPNCKMETNVHPWISPFYFIYKGVELWANHMG